MNFVFNSNKLGGIFWFYMFLIMHFTFVLNPILVSLGWFIVKKKCVNIFTRQKWLQAYFGLNMHNTVDLNTTSITQFNWKPVICKYNFNPLYAPKLGTCKSTILQANTENSSHRKMFENYANKPLSNIVVPVIMQDGTNASKYIP